jgi:hypothetical protein
LLAESVRSIFKPPARLSWGRWHVVFVSILDDLLAPLGLPGEISHGEVFDVKNQPA